MELQMKSQTQHKTAGRYWSTPESFSSKGCRLLYSYTGQSLTINQEDDGEGMSMKGVYTFLHFQVGLSSPGIISKRGGFRAPDGDSAGS